MSPWTHGKSLARWALKQDGRVSGRSVEPSGEMRYNETSATIRHFSIIQCGRIVKRPLDVGTRFGELREL